MNEFQSGDCVVPVSWLKVVLNLVEEYDRSEGAKKDMTLARILGHISSAETLLRHYKEDGSLGLQRSAVQKYQDACEEVKNKFIQTYYCDDEITEEQVHSHWIGDEIGGVCGINDEFWNCDDMVRALELKVKKDKLFAWYYYITEDCSEDESLTKYNLKSWTKLKINKM